MNTRRYCPDNKNRRAQSESKKEKSQKKDLHSAKGSEKTDIKTPTVTFTDNKDRKESSKNCYKDLDYSSDEGSAMMVVASENLQVNGITIIQVPTRNGDLKATTILIDNGFSGFAMMSYPFAKYLGYEFQRKEGSSYCTAAGNMETSLSVTITKFKLPALSRHRTFSATFEVAPPESGDFGYGVIMGIGMMDELGIDQSRTDKMITWGPDIEVPMVPLGYWTETRIQKACERTNKKKGAGERTCGVKRNDKQCIQPLLSNANNSEF